jgi:hypothetical protein
LLAAVPALSLTRTTRLAITRWWRARAERTARSAFRGIFSVIFVRVLAESVLVAGRSRYLFASFGTETLPFAAPATVLLLVANR